MIDDPPLLAGAEKLTDACALPGVALAFVGAPGIVRGVTATEGLLAGLVPALFAAVTVKTYAVPFARFRTVQTSGLPDQLHVAPPGLAVTV